MGFANDLRNASIAFALENVTDVLNTTISDAATLTQMSRVNNVTTVLASAIDNGTTPGGMDLRPLLETDPWMAWPYITFVAVLLTLGTVGNVVIIGASIVSEELRKLPGHQFTVNLASADLCVTAVAEPMCILGVTHGKLFFDEVPWLCELVACTCLTACFCAFLSLGMLTLNRYILVFHRGFYHAVFPGRAVPVYCILIWVAAALLEMPNFVGWGDHFYDTKNAQCIWDRTASLSYTLFVSIGLVGGPLLLMLMAYMAIFTKILHSKKHLYAPSIPTSVGPISQSNMESWNEAIRTSRTLLLVTLTFVACWTPYVVLICMDFSNQQPYWMHLWITILSHMHSTLTFIIYGLTNAKYRHGYRKFLQKVCAPMHFPSVCACARYSMAPTDLSNSTQTTGTDVPVKMVSFISQ